MLLFAIMAVMTAAASLAVLVPLARAATPGTGRLAAERAVYRDQLAEIGRDVERGVVRASEAGAARTEIARRLIKAGGDDQRTARAPGLVRLGSAVGLFGIPAVALAAYLALGSPDLPDQPLAARMAEADAGGLVARVAAHLAANPEDGSGWAVIGPVYLRLGRYDDAVRALGNADRLLGETAERAALTGEALFRAAGERMTPQARAAFERAVALDPKLERARFYLAVGLGQDGRRDEAMAAWKALIADAPADAAWLDEARAELAALEGGSP